MRSSPLTVRPMLDVDSAWKGFWAAATPARATDAASNLIFILYRVASRRRTALIWKVRALFLYLSHQARLRRWMETSRIARRLSRRFVAGETLADALAVGRKVNSEGISLTLDHLGENVTSLAEAETSRDVYQRALAEIQAAGVEG